MPGYIKPKGPNRWLVNADLGRDEHGRRKYVAKTVHGTEKDAKKALRAMETARDQGTLAKAPATMTLNAYLDCSSPTLCLTASAATTMAHTG